MGTWTREELQEAHDGFIEAATEAGRTGDWSIWADRFTEDAEYHEHLYGKFHGRAEITEWITKTMGEWPRLGDDPVPPQLVRLRRGAGLVDLRDREPLRRPGRRARSTRRRTSPSSSTPATACFSSEEDVYNPATFAPMVKALDGGQGRPQLRTQPGPTGGRRVSPPTAASTARPVATSSSSP